jgi:hypothetical protein
LETINNVPVHIGVQDLKKIAFLTLHPPFLKWSKEAHLSIDELHFHNKDWVELVPLPGTPDVDAIAAKFFLAKGKARNIQFHAGKVVVFLEIAHEKYTEIVARIDELETGDNDILVGPGILSSFLACFHYLTALISVWKSSRTSQAYKYIIECS